MTKLLTIILAFTIYTHAYGQKIRYESDLQTALIKAKENKKPIFLLVGPPSVINNHSSVKMPAFKSGLEEPEVGSLYNKNFINVKINVADSAVIAFRKIYPYKIESYPAYLFFDSEGRLLYKGIPVLTSGYKRYVEMGNEALKAASSNQTLSTFENLRTQGKLDGAGLKQYITLKQSLGLFDNAQLIDEYVNTLTIKSFDDYNEVVFILKAGPFAYGKTYTLCYSNRKLTDSIYKKGPIELRKEINGHIQENTRREAIRTKNIAMANQLSTFSRNIWSTNYKMSNQWGDYEMLAYYNGVKDTANYYRHATYYYDRYYMSLSADSIERIKKRSMEAGRQASLKQIKQVYPGFKNTITIKKPDTVITKTTKVITTYVASGPVQYDVANILNNEAYRFYNLGTRNSNYLTKALMWAKRAVALSPNMFAYYDTMAHLLYRLDFKEEAIFNQKKAIELAKQTSMASTNINKLKNELAKMQDHKL